MRAWCTKVIGILKTHVRILRQKNSILVLSPLLNNLILDSTYLCFLFFFLILWGWWLCLCFTKSFLPCYEFNWWIFSNKWRRRYNEDRKSSCKRKSTIGKKHKIGKVNPRELFYTSLVFCLCSSSYICPKYGYLF